MPRDKMVSIERLSDALFIHGDPGVQEGYSQDAKSSQEYPARHFNQNRILPANRKPGGSYNDENTIVETGKK